MNHQSVIREEELKNRVATVYFGRFDCTRIVGNIDFCVSPKRRDPRQMTFVPDPPILWAEAKNHPTDVHRMLAQLILTIGRAACPHAAADARDARPYHADEPPKFVGCFDNEKIAFVEYHYILPVFNLNDFNWTQTPSAVDDKTVETVRGVVPADKIVVFRFGADDAEIKSFIARNFTSGGSPALATPIDRNNFTFIYQKWRTSVMPHIDAPWDVLKKKYALYDRDFFLAEMNVDDNGTPEVADDRPAEDFYITFDANSPTPYTVKRKNEDELNFNLTFGFKANGGRGATALPDDGRAASPLAADGLSANSAFWRRYKRPPKREYWDFIVSRLDLLVPQDVRERKGSFFTPAIWVEKSQQYIAAVLGENWQDDRVNGRGDLLDFTPVLLDISKVFPARTPDSIKERVSWKLQSDVVNAVWTSLSASDAGSFHRTEDAGATFGPNLSQNAREAMVTPLADGADLPVRFLREMRLSGGKGVIMVEGRARGSALSLQAFIDESPTSAFEGTLDIKISPVEDMYRWYNSRGLSGESVTFPTNLNNPTNRPDSETSDRHLVFVHGANVTQNDARAWASEVFKRMWQSGMTAKFTAVTWRSDIGSDANYHENASNAFFMASVLAPQIAGLPGTKVLMAHSLGNMVCSSMIQDYGLQVSKYLMCNSAVPSEAYCQTNDTSLRVPQLVHPEWEEYPTNSWAASWHWLFRNDPNDDRKFLGWPGRFSNVEQYAVNFYSTGDEVLELAGSNNLWPGTGILGTNSWGHLSWHKQELFKGRGIGVGAGATDWSGWNIEENIFGVNKISVSEAQNMQDEDFKTNTVFYCYPPSMNQPTIPLLVRGAHLALGIPALTPAAGRVKFQGWDAMTNFDLNSKDVNLGIPRPNAWPNRSNYQGQWCHSDLRDVAYFYVFKFYDKAIEKGNLR